MKLKSDPMFYERNNSLLNRYSIVGLLLSCLLVYWPVFTHNFQFFWDDQWVVMNDYTEGGLYYGNIVSILTEFYHGQYSPVNELYYLVLYNLFEYNPFWFHAAGLAIHIANVLLVYFLIRKILTRSGNFQIDSILRISFITAMLMAVHPFLVEAVAWISASKCILFSFFYLISLHFYVAYIRDGKVWQYLLVLFFFIVSFGTKEQAITMPACLLLFDYIFNRDLKSSKVWFEKLPFFCLSACFSIITIFSQVENGEGVLSSQVQHPFYQNFFFASYSIVEYIIKCLLPIRLNYLYPFPNLPNEPLPTIMWLYPALLIVLTIGFWKFWTKKWVLFGIGFFLIQISIASNIIPTSRFAIIADRYVYLPSIGIFFVLGCLIDSAIKNRPEFKRLVLGLCLIFFISLSAYAIKRCEVWKDSESVKKELKQTIMNRPDFEAWMRKNQE